MSQHGQVVSALHQVVGSVCALDVGTLKIPQKWEKMCFQFNVEFHQCFKLIGRPDSVTVSVTALSSRKCSEFPSRKQISFL